MSLNIDALIIGIVETLKLGQSFSTTLTCTSEELDELVYAIGLNTLGLLPCRIEWSKRYNKVTLKVIPE